MPSRFDVVTFARTALKSLVAAAGLSLRRNPAGGAYDQDGLWSVHDHEFMTDPAFRRAYARGVAAAGDDYRWHWRVHLGLWAAAAASKLPGDFVECGVNRGFMSSAIMEALDWDALGKTFYLLDTFRGDAASAPPAAAALARRRNFYVHGAATVRANFAQWRNVCVIEGRVPDTLSEVAADQVAFLHLDMNSAAAEVAALTALWPRLVPGAVVLFDDYGYQGYGAQGRAIAALAHDLRVQVASLPTGQGLLLKPP